MTQTELETAIELAEKRYLDAMAEPKASFVKERDAAREKWQQDIIEAEDGVELATVQVRYDREVALARSFLITMDEAAQERKRLEILEAWESFNENDLLDSE